MDKVPKKVAPAKAKVIKKAKVDTVAVLAVKKVTPKNLLEKKAVTTLPIKAKAKPKVKLVKTLPVKKVTSRTKSDPDEVKLVPGTISLRLAEKRKLYERVYQDYVPKVMRPVAITAGYAYITIGIFLAMVMANTSLSTFVSQTASVLCAFGDCQTATTTGSVSNESIKLVEFMPLAPLAPGVDTNLQLILNQNALVKVTLLPVSGLDTITVDGVAESASKIVNFLLPTATLSNGSYLVQAEIYDTETKQVRARIHGPTVVVANSVEDVPEPVIEAEVLTDESPEEGVVLGVSTSTAEVAVEAEKISGSLPSLDELLPEEVEIKEINLAPLENNNVFVVTLIPGTNLSQSVLKILPTFVFDKVEIALKLKGNGETFFLGQATKTNDVWFYWLDNNTIPNGSYSLIVRGFDKGEQSQEATFAFSIESKPVLSSEADLIEIETRVNTLMEEGLDIEELTRVRESYFSSYLENSEVEYPADYLVDYLPSLDRLFAKYASAVAGKNDYLIILADEQIEHYLDDVIVSDNTDQSFTHELSALILNTKEYIHSQEAEMLKLSGGDSAFDIDKDGLTDYDEVVLYLTDPKLADTDNDGVLDSVEVILDFDATNPRLEAVSRFPGSIKNGIINGEVMAILAVEPFYLYTETDPSPKIFTSVTGKGIPNSFARLYLGESSESIIVKVGADGTFTHTLDKDYVKIEGEVTLAVTDNTGRIVLRGQPLELEKVISSKQLFNPAAIDAAVIKSVEEFTTSNIIGAVGVVSFGLILLLLGKTLVQRKEPVVLEIA